jgi:predicted nucleic acid-binding protein
LAEYVLDASAAYEYLLRTSIGLTLVDTVENMSLVAPELIDVEVLSALRREVLGGRLEEQRALSALEDLVVLRVVRISHRELIERAWRYRHNVTAYDALYIAAGYLYDVPVLTADERLSRAPGLDVVVRDVRLM